jgi:outer membrane protein insertion porin family
MGGMNLLWTNKLRVLALLMLFWGRLACAQQPSEKQAPSTSNPIVREVRVIEANGTAVKPVANSISIKVGEPLNRDQVADSIRTLYKTGNYANIAAIEKPVKDGIALDFVVQDNLFINRVVILGLKPPPTEASASGAMELSLGQTYREGDVRESVSRLLDALHDEGLYQAKVTIEKQPHPDTHQLDLIVHVVPGLRVHLANIELLNNSDYSDAELLKLFRLKSGSELTVARAHSAVERIRKFLRKKNYLSAGVSVRRGTYNQAANSMPLTLEVNAGPTVQLTLQGAKLSQGDLKKLIPVYQEASVDTDLLEEGKRNLRERLERDGYFDADVDYKITSSTKKTGKSELSTQSETIVYTVNHGPRYKRLRIEITGNHYFSKNTLLNRLAIKPSSLFTRPRFSRRLLDADVVAMKNLYAGNGFLSADVVGTPDEIRANGGEMLVHFQITEGKQTLISTLQIEGSQAIPPAKLEGYLGSLPGQPYSEASIASDRDNILFLYYQNGFPNATFSWTATPDATATSSDNTLHADSAERQSPDSGAAPFPRAEPMKLVYKIHEGEQNFVHRVLISGYVRTHKNIIERQIKVLKPGDPLREGDIVTTQQKLYNLGIFNRVNIDAQNANGTDPEKDVVVLVEEARRYTIAYGGGFEAQRLASTTNPTGGEVRASPRAIFEIAKENLTGRADTLSLKARASTIEYRALLGYSAPATAYFEKLSFQATAYIEKSQDINTFTQTRYEGNLQLTDQLTSRSSWLFRYAFRKVTLSNLNIPPEEVPLFNQPTLVSEFATTWFRDTRDNPADASKGSFNTVDLSVASTAIGSSASFLRLYAQNSTYHRLPHNWSLARSIRVGILQPFASTVSLTFPAQTGTPPAQIIPLPERFYAGGGTSLRGFALNQAGPRDSITGYPVGGQAMLILNQELRFPMKLPIVGTALGGTLFYDGGNVYSRLSRITLHWEPPAPVFKTAYPDEPPGRFNPTQCLYNCTNELNYFANTVGFGFRYGTPVGPLRLDLGYELNQPYFVIPCRNAAVFCQQATRLPKFQFFFNLGSSF